MENTEYLVVNRQKIPSVKTNNTQTFQKYENRLNKKLVKRLQENHGKTIENLDETKSRETTKEVEADGYQSLSEVYNPQSFIDGKSQWKEMKIKCEKHNINVKYKNDRKDKARTTFFVNLLPLTERELIKSRTILKEL